MGGARVSLRKMTSSGVFLALTITTTSSLLHQSFQHTVVAASVVAASVDVTALGVVIVVVAASVVVTASVVARRYWCEAHP